MLELSGSAQWRSAVSVAAGSPSEGVRRRYSVKLCSAGYQVVWMPSDFSWSRKRSRVGRSATSTGKAKWEERSTAGLVEGKLESADPRQPLAVGANGRPPRGKALVEPAQAAEPERGAGLVDAVVEADVDDVVGGVVAAVAVPGAAGHGVGAQQSHPLRQPVLGGAHHAALADAQLLLGEEAERSQLADRADLAAGVVDAGADRLGAVLDQHQPVLVAKPPQRDHVGRVSAEVHGDHGPRAGSDAPGDVLGVDVEVQGAAYVAEDRLGARRSGGRRRWRRT